MTSVEAHLKEHLLAPKKLGRGDYFLRTGQYAREMLYLHKGYLRIFATAADGREVTQWISSPGYFVTDLASFYFGAPARWNVQALTDCAVQTVSKEEYERLGRRVGNWAVLENEFLGHCFVTLENRVFSLLSTTARERYEALFDHAPELFNAVPLRHLASMLGMTPETLSRLRNPK